MVAGWILSGLEVAFKERMAATPSHTLPASFAGLDDVAGNGPGNDGAVMNVEVPRAQS
jgi:hypothetical protein